MMKLMFQTAWILCLSACSIVSSHSPLNERCPAPATDANGMMQIQDGQSLKCQILQYTSNMGCSEKLTNPQGDDGLACINSAGKGAIFFFDKNGVLKSHQLIQQ